MSEQDAAGETWREEVAMLKASVAAHERSYGRFADEVQRRQDAEAEVARLRSDLEDYQTRLEATADSWRLLSIERDALKAQLAQAVAALEGVALAHISSHPEGHLAILTPETWDRVREALALLRGTGAPEA